MKTKQWYERKSKDIYTKKATKKGFVARSAFKIIEIEKKYNFIKKSNSPKNNHRERRFVNYSGIVEASKVPQCWNAWLHHVVKDPPINDQSKPEWIKEHTPNLTGSPYSYEYTFEKNTKKTKKKDSIWSPDD